MSDAEFSSKECFKELWKTVEEGLVKGFVVREHPAWHRVLYRFKGFQVGYKREVEL